MNAEARDEIMLGYDPDNHLTGFEDPAEVVADLHRLAKSMDPDSSPETTLGDMTEYLRERRLAAADPKSVAECLDEMFGPGAAEEAFPDPADLETARASYSYVPPADRD